MKSAEGHVLVDGGVMNNLPVDVMQETFQPATLMAVDLRADTDLRVADLPTDGVVSGWKVSGRRLAPWKPRMQVPRMIDILLRVTETASGDQGVDAEYIFQPPVEEFGILDFRSYERIIEAGYRHTQEQLKVWADEGRPLGG